MSLFDFLKKKNACQLLADPGDSASQKYRHFREMLSKNDSILDGLAALEQAYYGGEPFTMDTVRRTCLGIGEDTFCMIKSLNELSQQRHQGLYQAFDRVLKLALKELEPKPGTQYGPLVLSLSAIGEKMGWAADFSNRQVSPAANLNRAREGDELEFLLGGKASKLAQVRNVVGLPTPDGFVLTTAAFHLFMQSSGLASWIAEELAPVTPLDLPDLETRSLRIRDAVLKASFPEEIIRELATALQQLAATTKENVLLAVRSSAVGEDGAASFAGQYESVLNVSPENLEAACRQVFASKYNPRAILYRLRHGLDDADVPMAALVLGMVQSRTSGVLYTVDPAAKTAGSMRLDVVEGLGEKLVSGEALPSVFLLSREKSVISSRPEEPLLSDSQILDLGKTGLALEEYFRAPQDVEWCIDAEGQLFIVQSRPLGADDAVTISAQPELSEEELANLQIILIGGVAASPGAACGEIVIVEGTVPESIPEGCILVARNAAPELAALMDRAGGIITAMGGAASHLASVAREMRIPALFGVTGCPDIFSPGQIVTLDASGTRVLQGQVESLLFASKTKSLLVDSPMHRRLRAALDHISPLTLTDPQSANFVPEGCETIHDIVRYTHEKAMREMFGLCENAEGAANVARLKAQIPLSLYCVDLGGGLREFLTTCDDIKPEDLRSVPMCAIWRGFTHPGITWSGAVAIDARSFMSLMASSVTTEGGGTPGGDSYALLGSDYMNLSARFGYHFANIDSFCGDADAKNHIKVRFAGGAGTFSGKCLRVTFLAKVLARLGFTVDTAGDVLDASLKGAPRRQTEETLDQLGRLMAVSRLLDMAITGQSEIDAMAAAFFRGDYDLLGQRQENPLPEFHLAVGDWECLTDETGAMVARQDGTRWVPGLSMSFANFMGRLSGQRYQRFLDNVEAYFYFPLAVAKGSDMEDGRTSLKVKPTAGAIDQAGGLAFAIRTAGTYLVLRINALENNLMLFAFKDGRRSELASVHLPIETGQWRELAVEVRGNAVTGFVDGKPYIIHHFDYTPRGLVGLWSKADSVVEFTDLRRKDNRSELAFLSHVPAITKTGEVMDKTISPAQLRSRIESGEDFLLLDLRKQEDFDADPVLLQGAVKLDPSKVSTWEDLVAGKPNTVLYCARGGGISQSIQKHFEQKGMTVPYLEGGLAAWKNLE